MMVAQRTSQVHKMVGIHTGSRQMRLMRVMLGLALCALIGGTALTASAWQGDDSAPPHRIYTRLAGGILVSVTRESVGRRPALCRADRWR
jgi:hypothetical protein